MKNPECPWCEQTNFMCGIDKPDHDALKECEFRTLKKEKKAILNRMKELVKSIKASQEVMKTSKDRDVLEKNVRNVLDKMFGLEKMIECLEKEFKMKRADALKEAGYEGMTISEKARAIMKLKQLQRGAK